MSLGLHALVLENEPVWAEKIQAALKTIEGMTADVETDADRALQVVTTRPFSLVTVDISLIGNLLANGQIDEQGLQFLARMRHQQRDVSAAVVIISGYGTPQTVRDAFAHHDIDDFVDKGRFDSATLPDIARRAILKARLRTADRRSQAQHQLKLSFNATNLQRITINGPRRNGAAEVGRRLRLDQARFSTRSERIDELLRGNMQNEWRALAQQTGFLLYNSLIKAPAVAEELGRARDLSSRVAPTIVSFSGPSVGLRIPFELLTNENDYLCLEFIVTRELVAPGLPPTKKGEPFHRFISELVRSGEPLRVLLVGVNSDATIPASEDELYDLRAELEQNLRALGIPYAINVLCGAGATYKNVETCLQSNEYHLFHYSGHGEYNSDVPEKSGVILGVGADEKRLTAADLKRLLNQTAVRCVFLNCCVGAMTAEERADGDFCGALEAIVRADVPFAIGHRWSIPDENARRFAITFYRDLFRTFSPGMSILAARNAATDEASGGRQNPLWASAVFVSQAPT